MKFYTHEQVKNLPKGRHIIALLTKSNKQLIGLAEQNHSYVIKNNGNNLEEYDFIVCTKVVSCEGEYLIAIGYSNEDEWNEQELTYKKSLIHV